MLELLKSQEGLRLKAYLCPAGYWTIGYGINLEASGLLRITQTQIIALNKDKLEIRITQAFADELLHYTLASLSRSLRRRDEYVMVNKTRRGVLLNMAYNMGLSGLFEFKRMFRALRVDDYENAAREMLDSYWARSQCPSRARVLAGIMKHG